jgi:hypothetical protein
MPESQAPAVHVRPDNLLKQTAIIVKVDDNPELVAIQIGNTTLRIGYEDALKLSQWIRVRAKEAKHICGDRSRHWSVVANLTNLES